MFEDGGCEARRDESQRAGKYCKVTVPLFIGIGMALTLVHLQVRRAEPQYAPIAAPRALAPEDFSTLPKPNTAFIIVKGKAATPAVVRLIHKRLRASRIGVVRRGRLSGGKIVADGLVAKTYGEMHAAAMSELPSDLDLSDDGLAEFSDVYGDTWENLKDSVENARVGRATLSITAEELHAEWSKHEKHVKLSASATVGVCQGLKIINGYFPALANTFYNDGIYYLEVKFKPTNLAYHSFSTRIIGSGPDPDHVEAGTLRHELQHKWKELGLLAKPDMLNVGIIATDSALMGWLVPVGWLNSPAEHHPFYSALVDRHVDVDALLAAADFRDITFEGVTGSVFDHVAGRDRQNCLIKLAAMFPLV